MRHERCTYFTSAAHILTVVGHITQHPSIYISSAMFAWSTIWYGCVQFIAHQWISDTKVREYWQKCSKSKPSLKKGSKRRKKAPQVSEVHSQLPHFLGDHLVIWKGVKSCKTIEINVVHSLPWGSPLQSAPSPQPLKINYNLFFFFKSHCHHHHIIIPRWIIIVRPGSQSCTGAPLQGCEGGRTSWRSSSGPSSSLSLSLSNLIL